MLLHGGDGQCLPAHIVAQALLAQMLSSLNTAQLLTDPDTLVPSLAGAEQSRLGEGGRLAGSVRPRDDPAGPPLRSVEEVGRSRIDQVAELLFSDPHAHRNVAEWRLQQAPRASDSVIAAGKQPELRYSVIVSGSAAESSKRALSELLPGMAGVARANHVKTSLNVIRQPLPFASRVGAPGVLNATTLPLFSMHPSFPAVGNHSVWADISPIFRADLTLNRRARHKRLRSPLRRPSTRWVKQPSASYRYSLRHCSLERPWRVAPRSAASGGEAGEEHPPAGGTA